MFQESMLEWDRFLLKISSPGTYLFVVQQPGKIGCRFRVVGRAVAQHHVTYSVELFDARN